MIVAMLGLAGSGKDTATDYLTQNYNFVPTSFADNLKHALAHIFSWDYHMLQGKTRESRQWREEVDVWWSNRLGIPNFTPRYALTHIGTEIFRNAFHGDIWVASLERSMLGRHENIVISDARFPNELDTIKRLGGVLYRVVNGVPVWENDAIEDLEMLAQHQKYDLSTGKMATLHPKVHISEWIGYKYPVDATVYNVSTKKNLFDNLDSLLSSTKSAL